MPVLPVPMTSAPFWSKVRSYGESSRDSQSWSHTPSGAMRYTAPFCSRRSSRGAPAGPAMSTTEIDVISADTEATGARGSGGAVSTRSPPVTGAPPDVPRPFTAAT